jgi:hypothetical protein
VSFLTHTVTGKEGHLRKGVRWGRRDQVGNEEGQVGKEGKKGGQVEEKEGAGKAGK